MLFILCCVVVSLFNALSTETKVVKCTLFSGACFEQCVREVRVREVVRVIVRVRVIVVVVCVSVARFFLCSFLRCNVQLLFTCHCCAISLALLRFALPHGSQDPGQSAHAPHRFCVQYSTMQYSIVQYSTVQYSAVQQNEKEKQEAAPQ